MVLFYPVTVTAIIFSWWHRVKVVAELFSRGRGYFIGYIGYDYILLVTEGTSNRSDKPLSLPI